MVLCGQPVAPKWRIYPLSRYEWEVAVAINRGAGEQWGESTLRYHSPAALCRELVYIRCRLYTKHSSRAVKLCKRIFYCKNKWATIVKRKLVIMHSVLWVRLRLALSSDSLHSEFPPARRKDWTVVTVVFCASFSRGIYCFRVGGRSATPAPTWRATSTSPTTWMTFGRRTSTR